MENTYLSILIADYLGPVGLRRLANKALYQDQPLGRTVKITLETNVVHVWNAPLLKSPNSSDV